MHAIIVQTSLKDLHQWPHLRTPPHRPQGYSNLPRTSSTIRQWRTFLHRCYMLEAPCKTLQPCVNYGTSTLHALWSLRLPLQHRCQQDSLLHRQSTLPSVPWHGMPVAPVYQGNYRIRLVSCPRGLQISGALVVPPTRGIKYHVARPIRTSLACATKLSSIRPTPELNVIQVCIKVLSSADQSHP
jgi:hypothetical protein